jgi:hypothetical protein
MAPIQQYLITARFVTTMGHFIALLLLFSTIQNNINASLGDNYTSAEREEANKIAWVRIVYFLFCWSDILLCLHWNISLVTNKHIEGGADNRVLVLRLRFWRNVLWNITILQYGMFLFTNIGFFLQLWFLTSANLLRLSGQHVSHFSPLHRRHSVVLGGH